VHFQTLLYWQLTATLLFLQNGCSHDLISRLNYAKNMIEKTLNTGAGGSAANPAA